jgi:hypothetical protein
LTLYEVAPATAGHESNTLPGAFAGPGVSDTGAAGLAETAVTHRQTMTNESAPDKKEDFILTKTAIWLLDQLAVV